LQLADHFKAHSLDMVVHAVLGNTQSPFTATPGTAAAAAAAAAADIGCSKVSVRSRFEGASAGIHTQLRGGCAGSPAALGMNMRS
jgi:hypothetical protein